jgi:hypothetical protein
MRELITQFRRLLMRQRICRKAELLEIVAAGRHEVELPDRLSVNALCSWECESQGAEAFSRTILENHAYAAERHRLLAARDQVLTKRRR